MRRLNSLAVLLLFAAAACGSETTSEDAARDAADESSTTPAALAATCPPGQLSLDPISAVFRGAEMIGGRITVTNSGSTCSDAGLLIARKDGRAMAFGHVKARDFAPGVQELDVALDGAMAPPVRLAFTMNGKSIDRNY